MTDAQETPATVTPLRISKLTLNAFRAFPHEVTIDFKSKNLLVYGENGSGKSSIFHALKNFFSLKKSNGAKYRNVFIEKETAKEQFCVKVEFNDDNDPAEWRVNAHPSAVTTGADPRVTETALQKSALDYRSLLDTNYIHGDDRPNLFDIVVKLILADYPVTIEGGTTKTISELWKDVVRNIPNNRPYDLNKRAHTLVAINQACVDFSTGLRTALTGLQPHLNTLLAEITKQSVTITEFEFSSIHYKDEFYWVDRIIVGKSIFPKVKFGTHNVPKPQNFLNEARLSAIALSMYLAGRLACVPTGGDNLKLLVLDDVLIGLDHSNRMPILKLIKQKFSSWQIVILTHDKVWFGMARKYFENSHSWEWLEINADGNDGRATPTLKKHGADIIAEALTDARNHIGSNAPAAANSTRRAFEATLRRFAEKRRVRLAFKMEPKDCTTDVFLSAIDSWADEKPVRSEIKDITALLGAMQTGVLNPQSHADAPNPSTAEVESAIEEVGKLKAAITNNKYN